MREIKFRAWDKKKEQMHYGVETWDELPFIINPQGIFTDFILMQYTGLKDKNGKEIYEGDILDGDDGFRYLVKWDSGGFVVVRYDRLDRGIMLRILSCTSFLSSCKIIGNIYENPELLEEVEK